MVKSRIEVEVEPTRKHRVDQLEGLVDLLADLSTSQDNLATDEDQENDLGLHHAIDQTGEEFRLVGAEVVVTRGQSLQTDRELDIARADDILNLEIGELGIEAELLDDTGVLARGKLRVIFRLGTGHDHLARGEDKGRRLGFTDTHDHSGKTLREKSQSSATLYPDVCIHREMWSDRYLRIVLGVASVKRDGLEIETAVQVDGSHDVPLW